MKIVLYHNNNCSKSRICKKILEEININFELREYLKNPMTKNEIKTILENLEEDLDEIIRDKSFKKNKKEISIDRLTNVIFAQPNIMQRPLVYHEKYHICRPPEKVLKILNII